MGVYDVDGNDLYGDIGDLQEATELNDSFFETDSPTLGAKKVKAYKYIGDNVSKMNWKSQYLGTGQFSNSPFVHVYVDAVNGSDNNEGSSDYPVQTINKAFELALKTGNEFRVYLVESGNYQLSGRTITGACIHIWATKANTILTFDRMAFYDCHFNFSGTTTNMLKIVCTNLPDGRGWYLDGGVGTFHNVDLDCRYSQNGGACLFENCILHETLANYADIRLDNVSCGDTLGEIDAIYKQDGGTLSIVNGIAGVASDTCSKMLDLHGVFATIRSSASGDLTKFTTRINADASLVLGASSYINSFGTTAVSNGGCILDGKTFIKP